MTMSSFSRFSRQIAPVILMSCALAGCKVETEIPVYTSDVESVMADGKFVDAEMVIAVPISSVEKCDEYGPKAVALAKDAFRRVELGGCEKRGFDSVALLKVSITVMKTGEAKPTDAIAVGVSPGTVAGKSGTMISIVAKPDAVERLLTKAEEIFYSKPDGITIQVMVQNDLKAPVRIIPGEAFVDGSPNLGGKAFTLKRRESLQVVPSDVRTAAFRQNNPLELGMIVNP